jgi:hypothetical protein
MQLAVAHWCRQALYSARLRVINDRDLAGSARCFRQLVFTPVHRFRVQALRRNDHNQDFVRVAVAREWRVETESETDWAELADMCQLQPRFHHSPHENSSMHATNPSNITAPKRQTAQKRIARTAVNTLFGSRAFGHCRQRQWATVSW